MTRRSLSDSQLDAEAAAPREERTGDLDTLIRDHRLKYRDEVFIERLHTIQPNAGRHTKGAGVDDQLLMGQRGPSWNYGDLTYGNRIGQPWSQRMNRYVGGIEWDGSEWLNHSYGVVFPWVRAYNAQTAMCRGVHHEHADRKAFRGSLCRRLVSFVVIGNRSVPDAAGRLGLGADVGRAGLTLSTALRWIDAEIARHAKLESDRERVVEEARNAREAVGWVAIPVHEHHRVGGLHAVECPHWVCRQARAA